MNTRRTTRSNSRASAKFTDNIEDSIEVGLAAAAAAAAEEEEVVVLLEEHPEDEEDQRDEVDRNDVLSAVATNIITADEEEEEEEEKKKEEEVVLVKEHQEDEEDQRDEVGQNDILSAGATNIITAEEDGVLVTGSGIHIQTQEDDERNEEEEEKEEEVSRVDRSVQAPGFSTQIDRILDSINQAWKMVDIKHHLTPAILPVVWTERPAKQLCKLAHATTFRHRDWAIKQLHQRADGKPITRTVIEQVYQQAEAEGKLISQRNTKAAISTRTSSLGRRTASSELGNAFSTYSSSLSPSPFSVSPTRSQLNSSYLDVPPFTLHLFNAGLPKQQPLPLPAQEFHEGDEYEGDLNASEFENLPSPPLGELVTTIADDRPARPLPKSQLADDTTSVQHTRATASSEIQSLHAPNQSHTQQPTKATKEDMRDWTQEEDLFNNSSISENVSEEHTLAGPQAGRALGHSHSSGRKRKRMSSETQLSASTERSTTRRRKHSPPSPARATSPDQIIIHSDPSHSSEDGDDHDSNEPPPADSTGTPLVRKASLDSYRDVWAGMTKANKLEPGGGLGDGWLSDSLVNIISHFFVAHRPGYVYIDSLAFQTSQSGGHSNAIGAVKGMLQLRLELGMQTSIVAMLNKDKSHWLCATADLADRQVHVYDSLSARHSTRSESWVTRLFATFLSNPDANIPASDTSPPPTTSLLAQVPGGGPHKSVPAWSTQATIATTTFPQQTNTKDCGIFAIMAALAIVTDTTVCDAQLTPEHVRTLRIVFGAMIHGTPVYGRLPVPARDPLSESEDDIESWNASSGVLAALQKDPDLAPGQLLALLQKKMAETEEKIAQLVKRAEYLEGHANRLLDVTGLFDALRRSEDSAITDLKARIALYNGQRTQLEGQQRDLKAMPLPFASIRNAYSTEMERLHQLRRRTQADLDAVRAGWKRWDAIQISVTIKVLEDRARACRRQAEKIIS
ncbi:hypothetical protein N0V93_010357 [Gnomoniopsis smithogilvyi]|uniref:Ubiquitin-like protease family profile domain-containing protein n=1 Tax=Gnomoniopsis smithogilvyi TaxID=1191159 RepID=A0A9W8YI07_9PEZI|nr:hypothetical protein N0V93_010357 [Gnomoniopsis smithogilvyi]